MALLIKTQLTILDARRTDYSYLMHFVQNYISSKTNNKLKRKCWKHIAIIYIWKTIYKQNVTYTEEVRKEIKNYYEKMMIQMDDRYDS